MRSLPFKKYQTCELKSKIIDYRAYSVKICAFYPTPPLPGLNIHLCFLSPSITEHTGGGGLARMSESKSPKYLPKNSNIRKMPKSYPLNILKVQSESSKISNLGEIFIFTENCTPNYPNYP